MRWLVLLLLGLVLATADTATGRDRGAEGGWLGVDVENITQRDADALGWDQPHGAKLIRLTPDSPAAAAGLQSGDVLISLNGVEIENVESFRQTISGLPAGTDIKLAVRRDGREKRFTVKLVPEPLESEQPKVADAPIPVLDTGGHMGLIRRIAFTPDGKQLVSASTDKTVRVWDLETGKTVRVIRGASTPGRGNGEIHAMALSPDGKWVAVAGSLRGPKSEDEAIRLFDLASGKLVAVLPGHADSIGSLAFSADGRQLMSASGGVDTTARIWDVATRLPVQRLLHNSAMSYAVGFMPDGARVVTVSKNNFLQLFSIADGRTLITMEGHKAAIFSLAVSRDGTIASGDWDGEIRLWQGRTGALLKTLPKQKGVVGSLSFSPDGRLLLSSDGASPFESHVFDVATGSEIVTYKGHDESVIATAVSPDGRWAASAGGADYSVQLWDLRKGERRLDSAGKPLEMRGRGRVIRSVGFSADNAALAWGTTDPCHGASCVNQLGPLEYTVRLPAADNVVAAPQRLGTSTALAEKATAEEAFQRALIRHQNRSLSHRPLYASAEGPNTLDISEDGKIVRSIEGSLGGLVHSAYSFTPDGERIIAADAYGGIRAYTDREGVPDTFAGHDSEVLAIAPSPDGRYLVSGSTDQTVRLWSIRNRELLVSLFPGGDDDWVMWTPQGYYAASGPGAELIGWQINRGIEHEADYVTAAQLRKSLHRPDIVARAIQLASAEAAVKEAHGTDFKLADVLAQPVPRLRLTSPSRNSVLGGGSVPLTVELEETAKPVKLIRIQVNGRQVGEHLPKEGGGFPPGGQQFSIPLEKGHNTIRATAINEVGESSVELPVTLAGNGDLDRRGTLYLLAIGVDRYPNVPGNDLRFSGADAKAFADVMEKQAGALYERVIKRVLINPGDDKTSIWRLLKRANVQPEDTPTAANIMNALGLLRQARENDTVMVFVAGHAINEGVNYRFLPTDAKLADGEFLPASIVPWYAFQEAIENAKGRRILFLDTCHSGNSYNQRLSNDSYQANILVYSAARWDQLSQELDGLGHGIFTYATLEGIGGKAAKPEDAKRVTTLNLRDFLTARVKELANSVGGDQEPQYFRGRDADDYLLTRTQ